MGMAAIGFSLAPSPYVADARVTKTNSPSVNIGFKLASRVGRSVMLRMNGHLCAFDGYCSLRFEKMGLDATAAAMMATKKANQTLEMERR